MQLVSCLVRGEVLSRIDNDLRYPTQEKLDELKANTLLQLALKHLSPEEMQHAQDHGLGNVWWPQYPNKEAILRNAYIAAVELSLATGGNKPILTFWVRGLNRFEAVVVETATQIIVHWLTPDPPNANPPDPNDPNVHPRMDEGVWAVAEAARIDAYVEPFTELNYQGAADPERFKNNVPGVKAWHVVHY